MHEGIRLGSGSDYNEVSENYVHDIPGDGRGINTDVDSSWNWLHHNVVRRVAIGYNDQMSGWGNRWEYNLATDYRQWGLSIRMKDSSLTSPTPGAQHHGCHCPLQYREEPRRHRPRHRPRDEHPRHLHRQRLRDGLRRPQSAHLLD